MKQIGLWSLGHHWHWRILVRWFIHLFILIFFVGGGRLRPKSCKSKIHKFYSAWLLLSLFCLKLSEDCSSCKTPKSKSQYVFLLLFPFSWTQIKLPFFCHFLPLSFSLVLNWQTFCLLFCWQAIQLQSVANMLVCWADYSSAPYQSQKI